MQKYFQIMKGTWEEYMTYRLSFILWRVRMVIQLLVTYFLWMAIFSEKKELFGYSQSMILTYILLSSSMRTLTMSTRTQDIGILINSGDLSNWLIRPISFIKNCISREIADKSLNFIFSLLELILLFILLQAPFFVQSNFLVLLLTTFAISLGVLLFFYFSTILSYLAFWTQDIWAPRFLSFIFIEFFAGILFPIDILPKPLLLLSQSLPFHYFIYFPLKVYLGQLSAPMLLQGFTIGIIWVYGLWFISNTLWTKGLRIYTAQGR